MGIFGEPNKGFHATRIGGFALYDIVGTIILAYITSYFVGHFVYCLVGWFIAGELCHYIFGVKTAFIVLVERLL